MTKTTKKTKYFQSFGALLLIKTGLESVTVTAEMESLYVYNIISSASVFLYVYCLTAERHNLTLEGDFSLQLRRVSTLQFIDSDSKAAFNSFVLKTLGIMICLLNSASCVFSLHSDGLLVCICRLIKG